MPSVWCFAWSYEIMPLRSSSGYFCISWTIHYILYPFGLLSLFFHNYLSIKTISFLCMFLCWLYPIRSLNYLCTIGCFLFFFLQDPECVRQSIQVYSWIHESMFRHICFIIECSFSFVFTCFQVDMAALSQMKDSDLKDMGVPMVVFVVQLLAALHDT